MSVARSRPGVRLTRPLRLELLQPRVVELPPIDGFEPRHVDAFGEAQAHEQIFVGQSFAGSASACSSAVA